MMDHRKALTFPFIVDKDKLMDNPLRIPMTYLSPEFGRLERQVSWTAFPGCKLRRFDSQLKNGSRSFDHNHELMVKWGMARRKPCLILSDVLKTEQGKAYMEKMTQSHTLGNKGQFTSRQKETGSSREESAISKSTRSVQKETRNDKQNTVTPKCNHRSISSSSQRSKLCRRLQIVDYREDKEERKDSEEVIIGSNNGEDFKFADVVDCGLSVSWDPTEDTADCDEFSPASIKDRWTDQGNDIPQSLKRKRKDAEPQFNGLGSPKRYRESVLRLTGEDGRDGGPVQTHICLEEGGEDCDLDHNIVQFTVGAEERMGVLVPIINPHLEAADLIAASRCSLSSSQDNAARTSPSEPIVLSSDDEESNNGPQHCSPEVHTLVTVEDTVIQQQSSLEAVAIQQETSHIQEVQVLHVVVEEPTVLCVAFSAFHCGSYQGKSNGDIMIENQRIVIPFTDTNELAEGKLILERKELRKYSIWQQQELEALGFKSSEEPSPAAALLFYVSESAATAIQSNLCKLCDKQDGAANTGKASPFILMTLTESLQGMEGALLRSLLDIDCLTYEKSSGVHVSDEFSDLKDIASPLLSFVDSLELIRRTGLDPHLLSLMGIESSNSTPIRDQDSPSCDGNKDNVSHIPLEVNLEKETELGPEEAPELSTSMQPERELELEPALEVAPELDAEMQLKPEEDKNEQEPEKGKGEPTPVYTLCHRRTKGSYTVSMCRPDSSWTKFKHQGLARRLIQFPPPPLKGGITVTMEDLQCLDSGQYLNDVIIDFYLKYLLQESSDAVAKRSHIFSSFFYKQLTRRDNASEGVTNETCQRQRRHQRVKTWTRHVDIFKKDFLFVPVNQEAHWYLVVICFPGLNEPKLEAWTGSDSPTGNSHNGISEFQDQEEAQGSTISNDKTETPPPTFNHSDNADTETKNAHEESAKAPPPGPVNCTERTCQRKSICKRPCILIMDSLKLSLHERVFKLLREYLQSEWEVRRGSVRDFGPDHIKSSHCRVPLQDNSSDCGLYLLQYVESFLKDPVVHFDLPLHLERWFPRQRVRRKREEIRDLVLKLYRYQNLDSNIDK